MLYILFAECDLWSFNGKGKIKSCPVPKY